MKTKSSDPTITDVANLAGVSIATVSRVLNTKENVKNSTMERVFAAMEQLGYPYGPALETEKNKLIVVVIPDMGNTLYTQILQGIQTSCNNHHYASLIYLCKDVDIQYHILIEGLSLVHACGVIMLSPVSNPEALQEMNAVCPLVQCVEFHENCSLPYVSVDDGLASKKAVEYLISRGRRRIAFISGPLKYKYARYRYAGYLDALQNARITADPALVFHINDMSFDEAMSVASQMLLGTTPPDAIFATSDLYAAAAIKAAYAAGLQVPQDLSVIGFDNTFLASVSHPSITSVNMPQFQLGYMACEILADRIVNPLGEHHSFLLKTELVIRESV